MAAFQRPWHAGHTTRYQPRPEEAAGRAPGLQAGCGMGRAGAGCRLSSRRHGCSARGGGTAGDTQLSGIEAKPVLPPSTKHPLPSQGSSSARPGPPALRLGLQLKSLPPRAKDGSTPRAWLERSRQCLLLLHQPWCLLFQREHPIRILYRLPVLLNRLNFHSLRRSCCMSLVTQLPRRDLRS